MNNAKDCVQIPCDISGRYAHRLTYLMQSSKSTVFILSGGRLVNAKSLLGVLSLCLKQKSIVDVFCYNDDTEQAERDLKYAVDVIANINKEE